MSSFLRVLLSFFSRNHGAIRGACSDDRRKTNAPSLVFHFFTLQLVEKTRYYSLMLCESIVPQNRIPVLSRDFDRKTRTLRPGRKVTDGQRQMFPVMLHYRDENVRRWVKMALPKSVYDGSFSLAVRTGG